MQAVKLRHSTGTIGNLALEKLAFLRSTQKSFARKMINEMNVSMVIDTQRNCLQFTGNPEAVERVITKVSVYLENLETKVVDKSIEFISCLKELTHKTIVDTLKLAQVRVGWDLREQKLWICGDSKPNIDKAEETICGLVVHGTFPESHSLSDSQRKAIVSRSGVVWREFKDQLIGDHIDLKIGCNSDLT